METNILERDCAGTKAVTAQLNYLAEATPKPVNYAYDPPAGVLRRSGTYVEHAIRNGREMLGKLSLDTNGFLLTEHETAVKDFYDPDEVKSVYYPEVERLLKRVTGPECIVIFDHHEKAASRSDRVVLGLVGAGTTWWIRGRGDPRSDLILYGNVDLRQVELAFNNDERIAAVLVQEGDRVSRGGLSPAWI